MVMTNLWVMAAGSGESLEEMLQPDVIGQFLSEIPEKALRLGARVLLAALFFLVGSQLIKLIRKIIKKSMQRAGAELGAIQFVDSFVKAALYVLLVLMLASSFGLDAASIVALLGSAGVAIGLAVQGSLSNLAGGVLLLILKPFKVGDYIQEGSSGKEGTVAEIQIFYTKLVTPDNRTIVLPNGSLANNSLINYTAQDARRMDIVVGISYKADLKKAKEVLLQVLEEDEAVMKDRDHFVFVAPAWIWESGAGLPRAISGRESGGLRKTVSWLWIGRGSKFLIINWMCIWTEPRLSSCERNYIL